MTIARHRKYGYDECGRFYIDPDTGERMTIEPYPWPNPARKVLARLWMLRWWIHGRKNWMPTIGD